MRSLRFQHIGPLPTFAGAAAGLALVIASGHLYRPALPLINPAAGLRVAQLHAAAMDRPRTYSDDCHLGAKETRQPDCLYGDVAASRSVVLFGDSHASHWFAPLDAAARQAGWQMRSWTKSACPSADVPIYTGGLPYTACRQWHKDVMAKLTGPERPALVIMSNSTHYADSVGRPGEALLSPGEREQSVRAGFRRTMERLLAAGVDVAVIRDIPTAADNYKNCFSSGAHCTRPREQALSKTDSAVIAAQELGDRVHVLDLTDQICDGGECALTRNGIMIYRNASHLTATFAATLTPQMTQLLQTVTAQRSAHALAVAAGYSAAPPPPRPSAWQEPMTPARAR